MIITPVTTTAQNTTLGNNNLTVDVLMETLIEAKLNWMKNSGEFVYNNCSLSVAPFGGSVTTTAGQDNFLLMDMADIAVWVQNFIDETVRRLDAGKGKVI